MDMPRKTEQERPRTECNQSEPPVEGLPKVAKHDDTKVEPSLAASPAAMGRSSRDEKEEGELTDDDTDEADVPFRPPGDCAQVVPTTRRSQYSEYVDIYDYYPPAGVSNGATLRRILVTTNKERISLARRYFELDVSRAQADRRAPQVKPCISQV